MKNKLSVILSVLMTILFSASMIVGCTEGQEPPEQLYTREGNHIIFGEYPQSLKDESVNIISFSEDQGYYIGSDGAKYCENQGEYYKVEPLRWRVVEEKDGKALIVCDSVIDVSDFQDKYWIDISVQYAGTFGDKTYYANDYRASNLRQFMQENIFEKAFTEAQKPKISVTYLEDVEAEVRVFALSEEEMQLIGCATVEDVITVNKNGVFKASDYAISRGVPVVNRDELIEGGFVGEGLEDCDGAAAFLIRTPTYNSNHRKGNAIYISFASYLYANNVNEIAGVLPALYLIL